MKKVALGLVVTLAALISQSSVFAGCGTCDKTIVENAVEGKFKTLVAAAKAAG